MQRVESLNAYVTLEKELQDLVLSEASDETSKLGNSSSNADSMCKGRHMTHPSKVRGLT